MARASEKDTRTFRYQQRSKDDVRERANMRGGNFDSILKPKYKMFKIRDGKNLIRILPPTWADAKHYGYDIYVNYGIGVDNQSYLSLGKMKGEPDPIAEAKRQADKDGDKKLSKALEARQRILMWVIDRNDEDEGPLLWSAPFTLDKAIANLSFDEDTKEVVFVDDPEAGCDVRFYKEGAGLKTDYDSSKIRIMKASPIHQDQGLQDEWLAFIEANPIPDCLQFYDYDHISTAFDGQARVESDDDEEGDVSPTRRRSSTPTKEPADDDAPPPRRRPTQTDAEDGEEPQQRVNRRTPVEEEEAPPRRQRAPVEEEETPPARTRARVAAKELGEEEAPSLRDRIRTRRSPPAEEPPFEED